MSGLDQFRDSRIAKSIDSIINNKIGEEIRNIDNPTVRRGVETLLDNFFPGVGGGTNDFSDNAFAGLIREKQTQSLVEQQEIINQALAVETDEALSKSYDWRARLRPKDGGADQFYSAAVEGGATDYLMRPIKESNGLIWKHTPTVFLNGSVEYNSPNMQGSNYPINTFQSSIAPQISITGYFSANDIYEARYLLAVLTFLKISTKAYFGDQAVADGNYGTPPPVLLFEYLGDHGFNKVPVTIDNYNLQLANDVDYVPVRVQDTVTYVPTRVDIVVNLLPSYTPHKLRRVFNLDRLANGVSYKDGFI